MLLNYTHILGWVFLVLIGVAGWALSAWLWVQLRKRESALRAEVDACKQRIDNLAKY